MNFAVLTKSQPKSTVMFRLKDEHLQLAFPKFQKREHTCALHNLMERFFGKPNEPTFETEMDRSFSEKSGQVEKKARVE